MTQSTQVPAGNKTTEIGPVPHGWVVNKLGDIGEVKMCRRIFNHETKEAGIIPFYKIGTFGKQADAYITPDLYNRYKRRFSFPKRGDVLISAAGTIGRTFVYDGAPSYFQDSNIIWIDNNENLTFNNYLYYILQVAKYNTEGGTIQRLYNKILKSTQFIRPPKKEQIKIAQVLSDIDSFITTLSHLIQKKRNIKQGAMQELLTGKRRLPGFTGEWEEKIMADFGKCYRGVSYNPESDLSPHDNDHTTRLLRSNNVQKGKIFFSDFQFVSSVRVSEIQKLQKNDMLLCMANGSRELVGKSGKFDKKDGYEYTFGAFMGCFRPNDKVVEPIYVSFLFQTEKYRKHIDLLLAGSSINNLKPSEVESFSINVPIDKTEQKAIAQVLSEMDAEIESLEKYKAKYIDLKQGVMQQLLTGKIRLL